MRKQEQVCIWLHQMLLIMACFCRGGGFFCSCWTHQRRHRSDIQKHFPPFASWVCCSPCRSAPTTWKTYGKNVVVGHRKACANCSVLCPNEKVCSRLHPLIHFKYFKSYFSGNPNKTEVTTNTACVVKLTATSPWGTFSNKIHLEKHVIVCFYWDEFLLWINFSNSNNSSKQKGKCYIPNFFCKKVGKFFDQILRELKFAKFCIPTKGRAISLKFKQNCWKKQDCRSCFWILRGRIVTPNRHALRGTIEYTQPSFHEYNCGAFVAVSPSVEQATEYPICIAKVIKVKSDLRGGRYTLDSTLVLFI